MGSKPYRGLNYPGCINSAQINSALSKINAALGVGMVWENIIIVAKSGGDYDSIQDAIDESSGTASTPCAILVMPGTYVETLTLTEYTNIVGVGELGSVIVADSAYTIVQGANNCVAANIVINQTGFGATTQTFTATVTNWIDNYYIPPTSVQKNVSFRSSPHTVGSIVGYGILQFDFSALVGATITDAKFYAYLERVDVYAGGSNPYRGILKRIRRYPNSDYTCWNNYDSGLAWGTAGCKNAASDYNGANPANADVTYDFPYPGQNVNAWDVFSNCITLINDMLAGSQNTVLLCSSKSASINSGLYSSLDDAKMPYFVISYTPTIGNVVSCAGTSPTFFRCKFMGLTSGSIGVSVSGAASPNILDCDGDSLYKGVLNSGSGYARTSRCSINAVNNHLENSGIGGITSGWNNLYGAGTHLVRSNGTLNTIADIYSTTSGVITLRGNADMVDGSHASAFAAVVHNHDTLYPVTTSGVDNPPTSTPGKKGDIYIANGIDLFMAKGNSSSADWLKLN